MKRIIIAFSVVVACAGTASAVDFGQMYQQLEQQQQLNNIQQMLQQQQFDRQQDQFNQFQQQSTDAINRFNRGW